MTYDFQDAQQRRDAHDVQDVPLQPSPPAAGASAASPGDEYFRIEQVAARTGLTKRTLRYYEEIGLLAPPTRTEGGYRLYSQQDIAHLERIKRMRDLLGFSLADIREMVEAEEEREQVRAAAKQETEPHARLAWVERAAELTERQLRMVEEKLAGLQEMQATLHARLERQRQRQQELASQVAADEQQATPHGHDQPDAHDQTTQTPSA